MSRKENYYATTVQRYLPKAQEIWKDYKVSHQFIIICKTNSIANANKIAQDFGFEKNTFKSDVTRNYIRAEEIKSLEESKSKFIIRPIQAWENESKDIMEVL